MILSAALLACAMNVAPATLEAIVRVESGGDPLALHINGVSEPQPHAASAQEAAEIARRAIGRGYSVDLGIAQVNSRNLSAVRLTIEQALSDPCANIHAGAAILTADYARAVGQFGEGQAALRAAISAYNAGNFTRGFENGYVAKVIGVPAITSTPLRVREDPYSAPTLAFSREDLHVHID